MPLARSRRRRTRFGNAETGGRRIIATSYERYNGGARTKRMYGSSTVTRFYVHFAEDARDPSKWEEIEGYGPTPGDRKTHAINEFVRRRS